MKLRMEIERTLGLMQAHLRHQRGGARIANSSVSLWILEFVILAPNGSSSERYFESLPEDACVVGRQLCELFPNVLARAHRRSVASLLLIGGLAVAAPMPRPAAAREYWGGDNGGTRYSPLRQITPANVGALVCAWQYSTGGRAGRRYRAGGSRDGRPAAMRGMITGRER